MLKVTTRYISSQLIPSFVVGFVFFVSFLITFYFFRIISLIINKGLDLLTVSEMVFNLAVSFFPLASSLSIFFSIIYTMNKLSEDSEIIAMRSFGLTKYQIFKPILAISFITALTIFSLNSVLIPRANGEFKNTIVRLTSTGMLSSIKSGLFFTDIPNVTLFAVNVSEDGNGFKDVFLHLNDKQNDEQKIIFAKTGTLIKIFADGWHAPSLRLHLGNGSIHYASKDGKKTEKVLFKDYDFPVFNSEFASLMLDKDSMKTSRELKEIIKERKENLKRVEDQLSKNVKFEKDPNVNELRKTLHKSENEYFARIVTPIQIILFSILAFSLGIKKNRGTQKSNTLIAFSYLLSYFALHFFLVGLAQKGKLLPIIGNFIPLIVLSGACIYLFKKLDWAD